MANSNVLVMKFGGTSVGKGMDKCVEIVQQTQATGKFDGLVVVTSALTQVCAAPTQLSVSLSPILLPLSLSLLLTLSHTFDLA